jgi:hypothetical protein
MCCNAVQQTTKGGVMGDGDDYFFGLYLIACEKDVVYEISLDAVTNRFAQLSPVLIKHSSPL